MFCRLWLSQTRDQSVKDCLFHDYLKSKIDKDIFIKQDQDFPLHLAIFTIFHCMYIIHSLFVIAQLLFPITESITQVMIPLYRSLVRPHLEILCPGLKDFFWFSFSFFLSSFFFLPLPIFVPLMRSLIFFLYIFEDYFVCIILIGLQVLRKSRCARNASTYCVWAYILPTPFELVEFHKTISTFLWNLTVKVFYICFFYICICILSLLSCTGMYFLNFF